MNNLKIINKDGQLLADSREVAEMTNARHADLLDKIAGYIKHLENGKFRSQDFFIQSSYKVDGNNKTYDCYLLTRKGCDMVANKMTGEKGVLFTAAYVTQFDEMERQLLNPFANASKELQAIFMLDVRTQEVELRVEKLENNTTIDYGQQLDLQMIAKKNVVGLLGGKDSAAYLNKTLRGEMFSALWHDFKGYFDVNSYRNTLKKEFEKAKEYVAKWQPQGRLLREVEEANGQLSI